MPPSSQSWLSLADEFATRQNIPEANAAILRAFGGEKSHEGEGTSFEAIESHFDTVFTQLSQSIVNLLSQEVDRDQAENFARRFEGVRSLALRLGEQNPVGRLFQFGLAHRMKEILDESKNLALRVRAVNDFYYSHVSVALHQIQSPECKNVTLASLLPTINWTSLTENISWGHLQGMTQNGPVNINFLKANQPKLETIHCAKHCPSERDFVDVVQAKKAVAGISGGFFLYSEPDIAPPSKRTDPVGLLIHQGNVVNLPIFHRSSLLQLSTGHTLITALGMKGVTLSLADKRFTLTQTNAPQFIDREVVSFNRAFGSHAPPHLGATVLVEANQVLRVVEGQTCPAIPLAGCAITLPSLSANLVAASELTLELDSFPYGDSTITEGMAGGPLLVTNGQAEIHRDREDFVLSAPPITFSQDETFDQNLLPRMAVGQLDADQFLFAAIDGRNIERAVGLSLEQTAHLMSAMGCHTAMNLDGGSSKRMVVQNRAVDLASTEVQTSTAASEKVRPVYSAILLHE